ncbi:MAG: hypothetical protein JNJ73_02785 [Hyphomonadaceae bacterium]|nr:hypothetical protein [Hyphomonadaceae bacterium]
MNINPIGTSSIVFVTLTGLIWGGWIVGSQTPQGQEALAKAYEAYAQQRSETHDDLFEPSALRALVCGTGGASADGREARPCLAVAAAGKLFVVDTGSGAAAALSQRNVPLGRLQAVLLTGNAVTQSADLDELHAAAQPTRAANLLPVYGPPDTVRLVDGLNAAAGMNGVDSGLQAWGPSPEPGRSVIVYEADGLIISAFTTEEDVATGRVGYRFDYRGRSLVVAGDGRAEWASAAANADVVLHSAQTTSLAHLHQAPLGAPTVAEVAAAARRHNSALVLTGAGDDQLAASLQVREARAAGLDDVFAGRIGMLLELPLANSEVNVRPL